jgi:four helix bundle protein
MEEQKKIKSFTDLHAWQEGHKLVLMVYKETENFPQKEVFGLTNQMRRAAVSATSNIAEGFSRNSAKEKYQFYCMAQGSITELQNHLMIARDVGYLDQKKFDKLAEQTISVHKLINGLKKIKNDTRYEIPNTKYEKSKGFTLIEFLVYTAIVVVVGVISIEFIINIYGGKAKAQSYFEIQENARLVMERITQEIHGAQGINTSNFGINLAANPGSKLSLQFRDASLNPTEFDVAGNVLRIKQGAAGPYELTNNQVRVTNLIFRNFSSPNGKSKNIGVELTIEHVNPSGLPEWQASISLRSAMELKDR